MNIIPNLNELIRKNIFNYLKKKNISYDYLLNQLYLHFPQEKIDNFFSNKENIDVDILIKISNILNEHLDYFCIPHADDENLSIQQEKLLELKEVCNQDFDIMSVDAGEKLLELTKYALDRELISISKASYYLSCSYSEIYNL